MTEITILYFAAARERAKRPQEVLEWQDGLTLRSLSEKLIATHPSLAELMPYIRFAVDEKFEANLDRRLAPGMTVALIPPVSGGRWQYIVDGPIDPDVVTQAVTSDECGAVVVFSGRVRNRTGKNDVLHLDYESYGSMAERMLSELVQTVTVEFPATRIAVQHRVGHLKIGEIAVVIAVASPHRSDAFDACRRMIDDLKADIPIFKKEARTDGSIWVGLGG